MPVTVGTLEISDVKLDDRYECFEQGTHYPCKFWGLRDQGSAVRVSKAGGGPF